jgi:hypothetical protein
MWFPILARLPFAIAGVIAGWFVLKVRCAMTSCSLALRS